MKAAARLSSPLHGCSAVDTVARAPEDLVGGGGLPGGERPWIRVTPGWILWLARKGAHFALCVVKNGAEDCDNGGR
jgi:hypothetical protein